MVFLFFSLGLFLFLETSFNLSGSLVLKILKIFFSSCTCLFVNYIFVFFCLLACVNCSIFSYLFFFFVFFVLYLFRLFWIGFLFQTHEEVISLEDCYGSCSVLITVSQTLTITFLMIVFYKSFYILNIFWKQIRLFLDSTINLKFLDSTYYS